MPEGKVTIRGADVVQRTLSALGDDLEDLDELAPEAAGLVRSAAQGFARVASGAMRSGIKIESSTGGARVVAGGGLGIYPVVQEYGSARRGITANRYMSRAGEQQEPRVVDLFAREVDRAVDRVKGA